MSNLSKKPLMLALSSPSGAGKTTLSRKIQQSDSTFKISVSHTTRKPRANEADGVDYHFVNEEKFKSMLKENAFYEHAQIFGNYYGTSKKSVNDLLSKKFNILFDIDWQGVEQLSKFKELNILKIFILPPNKEELKKRLVDRNQDVKESIEKRLMAYDRDVQHSKDYDHVLINENVDNCFKEIKKIIKNNLKN